MRILLTQSQTVQSATGPMHFEAGFVRGQVVNVFIGDQPGDEPLHHYPHLRVDANLMAPADDEARKIWDRDVVPVKPAAKKGAPRQ